MAQLAIAAAVAAAAGGGAAAAGATAATVMTVAEIGWMAGTLIASMMFRQKGPNPAEIRVQDSAYGKPIPFVYGMYRVSGNIIWAGQPYITDAGKGFGKGPSQQKVSMSFAVGLCAGTIASVRRIWANGKLIYDVSNPSNFQAISGSAQMVTNFTVYPGDENQEPDPTMQAALGVANVPAYRGLAYVVFNNLDLSQWGNFLPSFSFEVLTQPSSQASSQLGASFTTPWAGTGPVLISMPNLSASGGNAMAYNGYIYGQQAPIAVSMSAYGAQQFVAPQVNSGGLFGMPSGNSDVAGIWTTTGWLRPDGTFDDLTLSGWLGYVTTFWRNGSDLYVASSNAAFTTVARLQIVAGIPGGDPSNPTLNPKGGTVLANSVSMSGGFTVIGGTSAYVYAINGSTLYRLDRNTLATVATWTAPAGSPLFSTAQYVGYVLDDDHIYLQVNTAPPQPNIYLFRPSQNTLTAIGLGPFGVNAAGSFVAVSQSFFVFGTSGVSSSGQIQIGYMWVSQGQAYTTLSSIVADICNRAGLSPSQYDVSQLTDQVQGFSVTNHSTARSNLAPLMSTFFFDACDTDGLIKFVKRGGAIAGTFASADLGASPTMGDAANTTPIVETIAQEIDLPRSLSLTYPELNSDYNPNTQRAMRAITNSNKDTAIQVPIVLDSGDARGRAESMLWATWEGRKTFSFSTGVSYMQLEPGDMATLNAPNGEAYTVRLTRCQYDGLGSLIWTAALDDPSIYPSPSYAAWGGTAAGFRSQTIDYSGPTFLTVMDVPPLRSSDTSPGLYIAACGAASTWPGCALDISRDGSTYAQAANINQAAVMGYAATALPNFSGGNQPDELSTVSVVLYNGTLASIAYADFLNGLNAAYLGGELIFFRNATLTAASTYTLSGLLRARVGTEGAMGTHVVGEPFVLLDTTHILPLSINLTDIGRTLKFEAFLLNLFGSTVSGSATLTPGNARVKPLSPVLFTAGHGSAASLSDISLSWIRRARVNAQWLDGADVALDESAENYTLSVLNGSTVVRTVTVSGNGTGGTYIYTAANITADGFSSGNTINFSVAQNSDQGVLGTPATATITR
jgi:hypothetical protein